MKSGIYYILNIINNKIYIGSSKFLRGRILSHISHLNRNAHNNDKLQRSWNKYAAENFIFGIVEYCEIENLENKENYWIDQFQSFKKDLGFNILDKAVRGFQMPQETRDKLSISATERFKNPAERERLRQINLGTKRPPRTEEYKKKLSESLKRHKKTPEHCQNISRSKLGVKKSEDFKENRKKYMTGNWRKFYRRKELHFNFTVRRIRKF